MRCYRKILSIDTKTTLPTRKSVPRFSRQSDSDHRKETQSEVVWKCLPFIKFGQNHLARHSERGEKTRQTEKKSLEDNIREWTNLEFAKSQMAVENRKMEETGCGVFCVPTTPKVKG